MQNKGNEIRWGRKALACHFRFNSLYSWLIWDVFNFEIFTVHAAACLINSDSYILPWHIICSIKSFSWRTQHLAFVKWTIWRVCLTTPLQRTDKWFWFSGLKGQIHHFFFFFPEAISMICLCERQGGPNAKVMQSCLLVERDMGSRTEAQMLNLLFSLSWISSHPVHQGYQPKRGVDHWWSHRHHHRRQLLRRSTSCVWHHARMERGTILFYYH